MRQRLPRPRSSEGADLNGARRVSFRSTWRYTFAHLHTYTNMFCFYSSLLLLLLLLLFLQPSHWYYYYQRHSHRLLYFTFLLFFSVNLLIIIFNISSFGFGFCCCSLIFWVWNWFFQNFLFVLYMSIWTSAIAPYSAPIVTCMCICALRPKGASQLTSGGFHFSHS